MLILEPWSCSQLFEHICWNCDSIYFEGLRTDSETVKHFLSKQHKFLRKTKCSTEADILSPQNCLLPPLDFTQLSHTTSNEHRREHSKDSHQRFLYVFYFLRPCYIFNSRCVKIHFLFLVLAKCLTIPFRVLHVYVMGSLWSLNATPCRQGLCTLEDSNSFAFLVSAHVISSVIILYYLSSFYI